ncbi:hypothetical protein MKX01_027317 [Papaver californicum]|nr:hypothetical protein MKX01_027317 [Papaver californicum]
MESYTPIEVVGEGSFGLVWKAIDNCSISGTEIVAVKQMKDSCSSWEECLALPEIVLENKVLYLVFGYVEFTLHSLMNNKISLCKNLELRDELLKIKIGLFSEFEIRAWSRQIFLALAQMHRSGGYFHRDLKPANLLVTKDEKLIKIADFGQARQVGCQSPLLLNSVSYNSVVDMWAIGAIMAELYSFSVLFRGENREDQLYQICSVIGSPTHESWAEGIQLANSCGYKFPQVPAKDLIKSLCSWDPKKRPTAMEALEHPYFAPSLCVLPETITIPKFQQRMYPIRTCIGV